MSGRPLMIAIALAGFSTTAVAAQLSNSDQAAVAGYQSAIKSAESGSSSSRPLETAFAALVLLREALMQVREDRNTVLESLSDEEFMRLKRELPGALINREEVVLVEPDLDYFARLAAARGDEADRAFFAALKATHPESYWPVYLELQTDYAGCIRFGSMSLVETYGAWSGFQRKHPDRYVAPAQRETEAVLDHLTESTCACGDLAGVERELEQFVRRFPTSPARAKVDRRLQALRTRRSAIRTSCVAG